MAYDDPSLSEFRGYFKAKETKCFIYWGKHRISGGNTHWCEHAPLHWSVSGNKQEE